MNSAASDPPRIASFHRQLSGAVLLGLLLVAMGGCRPESPAASNPPILAQGLAYTNHQVPKRPWSIHVVRVDRKDPTLSLQAVHARNAAVGLSPLSAQIEDVPGFWGTPVAAVNGDFYQRDRAFAGDTRGLQITAGELISAPKGISFWLDAAGQPRLTNVFAKFELTWPDGTRTPFGLNEERRANSAVLYTPAVGTSTRTESSREFVLEAVKDSGLPTLAPDSTFTARIREVRDGGNSPLQPGTWVLSLGTSLAKRVPAVKRGDTLQLATATTAGLQNATTGLGGGPVLVRNRKPINIEVPDDENYQTSSMLEEHPRSAIGWNRDHFFFVTVDGRQRGSIGMTLDDLAAYLIKLGCEEAMNLDGGGSATLWCAGKIRNKPCDGRERAIANSLMVLRKTAAK